MRYTDTLTLIIFFAAGCFTLTPARAQLPAITHTIAGDNEAKFSISKLPSLDNFYDSSYLEVKPYPYWQVFWVFGDGNYYYRVGEMLPENSQYPGGSGGPGVVYIEDYKYLLEKDLEYTPIALMIDRKTDTPPPPASRPIPLHDPNDSNSTPLKTIQSGGNSKDLVDYPSVSPPLLNLNSPGFTRRVQLGHSHYLDSARWSAFIIAYYPETDGRLFFFNPPGLDSVQTFAPNFDYQAPSGLSGGQISSIPSSVYPSGVYGHYEGVTIFDFPNPVHEDKNLDEIDEVVSTDTMEELRLFHFMRLERLIEEDSTFLALWVANDPLSPELEALSVANFNEDKDFLVDIIDNSNRTFEVDDTTYFYIDADTLRAKSGEPKDPNELKVEEFYYCNDDYTLVHFSLRFCNISPFPTTAASVFISSMVGDEIYCFKLDTVETGFTHRKLLDACDASAIGCGGYGFCDGNTVQFDLQYEGIFKDRNTVGFDNCQVLYFTAVATGLGKKAIRDGGALKACVTFHETACELVCSFNEPAPDLDEGTIPEPCPGCQPPQPPCWPWIVGIVVLVVGILWFLWKRRLLPFARKK